MGKQKNQTPLVGMERTFRIRISQREVLSYLSASSDTDPLYSDPLYAALSRNKMPIVPPILFMGRIYAALTTLFPGHGTVVLGYTAEFLAPVCYPLTFTLKLSVLRKYHDKPIYVIGTTLLLNSGTLALSGEASVRYESILGIEKNDRNQA